MFVFVCIKVSIKSIDDNPEEAEYAISLVKKMLEEFKKS